MIFETGRNPKGSILFRISEEDDEGELDYEIELTMTPEDALHIADMLRMQAERARQEQRGEMRKGER